MHKKRFIFNRMLSFEAPFHYNLTASRFIQGLLMLLMLLRRLTACLLLILCVQTSIASEPPRLVVVIALDQFPYEYLTRFRSVLRRDGLGYLLENGANFTNAVYKHASTTTGSGHAVILTGAYANEQGIVSNYWYDRTLQRVVYCVEDRGVSVLGTTADGRSPSHLIAPTFGDQLRLYSGFHSKVVSISAKDRSAILLGGKFANGAYWMIDSLFVTSTYYMTRLPAWVENFNASGIMNSYFGKSWDANRPQDDFTAMDRDDAPYESQWAGMGRVFPHPIQGENPARITASYYDALKASPYGNEVLLAFVKAAVEGERLGDGRFTDLLCVSFSALDEVGHAFGPHSREIVEMVAHTDRTVADLLTFLNTEIGLDHVLLVLTSDHGVAPIPEYIMERVPGADIGRISPTTIVSYCESTATREFGKLPAGTSWVKRIVRNNIYLNQDVVKSKKLDLDMVASTLANALLNMRGVARAIGRREVISYPSLSTIESKLKVEYYPGRSGDIVLALKPFFYLGEEKDGAEHDSPYTYDAHVPLILLGDGIRKGTYGSEVSPADIAPTLSSLLGIEFPAAREGRVLIEALDLP